MYDALFPEQTEKSLLTSVPSRPQPRGIWGNLGGALKAIAPVSLAETARAVDAFRSTVGLSGGDSVESIQAGMPSLSTSMGRDIKRMTPDPETTGEASNIVFGFGKVIAKAIPLGAVGGLPAAAVGTGLIEGTADALRLQDEGVDPSTAAKVGAIKGVATGVGIALPIAGKTLGQTAALVLGGGPASFMAEQQASKMILDSADYGAIARQYNPFDPVGLTISALVPGAVAGVVHAGRARGARAAAAQASEAARLAQENLVANQKILDEAAAASAVQRDAQAASRADAEAAARTLQMAEHIRNTGLRPESDLAGAAAHVDAIEQARRNLDAGEPVDVAAVIRQVIDEQAAALEPERRAVFIQAADDLIALRQGERPMLTPEIGRAIEVLRMPVAERTAADSAFLANLWETGKVPEKIDGKLGADVQPGVTNITNVTVQGAEPKSLLATIRELGGIDSAEGTLRDVTGETRTGKNVKGIPPGLFHKKGKGLDDLATQLRDKGYDIPQDAVDGGVQRLKDMIRDEVDGTKHYSLRDQDAQFAQMADRARQKYDAQDLADAGIDGLGTAEQARALDLVDAELRNVDAEAWAVKSEAEKDAELDDIFGSDTGTAVANKEGGAGTVSAGDGAASKNPAKAGAELAADHYETAARDIAKEQPDLLVPDEAGNKVKASELVDQAEADFARERDEAQSFMAAAICELDG
jgi:hypothetical protein